jgi:hypothetical protein
VTAAAPPVLVLGELAIGVHDGARCLRWALGPTLTGLTVTGMTRALKATSDYLAALAGKDLAAFAAHAYGLRVRVEPGLWELPAVAGHEAALTGLMASVLNEAGSIGSLPS